MSVTTLARFTKWTFSNSPAERVRRSESPQKPLWTRILSGSDLDCILTNSSSDRGRGTVGRGCSGAGGGVADLLALYSTLLGTDTEAARNTRGWFGSGDCIGEALGVRDRGRRGGTDGGKLEEKAENLSRRSNRSSSSPGRRALGLSFQLPIRPFGLCLVGTGGACTLPLVSMVYCNNKQKIFTAQALNCYKSCACDQARLLCVGSKDFFPPVS